MIFWKFRERPFKWYIIVHNIIEWWQNSNFGPILSEGGSARTHTHTHTHTQVAKWVGDVFNEGIYDKHIELKGTPLLGWESPSRMERLSAEDVMNSSRLYYLFPITRVRSIVRILRTTAHSGFLVVSHAKLGKPLREQRVLPRKHRPQLYTRPSVLGDYDTEIDTDLGTVGSCPVHTMARPLPRTV